MRVLELAKDLKVETEALLQLLREMGIAVKGASAQVNEADAARVVARLERSRRAGAKDAGEAVQAAVEDASAGAGTRRRRRRARTAVRRVSESAQAEALARPGHGARPATAQEPERAARARRGSAAG